MTFPKHCGNSLKKVLLIDMYKAVTVQDEAFTLDILDDGIILNRVGVGNVLGKDGERGLKQIEIKDVMTHGYTACAFGSMIFDDNARIEF